MVDHHSVTERLTELVRDVLEEVEGQAKGVIFSVPVTGFEKLSRDDE